MTPRPPLPTVLQHAALRYMAAHHIGAVLVNGRAIWPEDIRRDPDAGAIVASAFGIHLLTLNTEPSACPCAMPRRRTVNG